MFSFLMLGPLCLVPFYLFPKSLFSSLCLRVNLPHGACEKNNWVENNLDWIFIEGGN